MAITAADDVTRHHGESYSIPAPTKAARLATLAALAAAVMLPACGGGGGGDSGSPTPSGDAAGLPITPLLARASEASTGEIRHAFRVTLRDAVLLRQHAWPARHDAGGSSGAIPYGAVMRLKAGFAIPSTWGVQAKALATAMQRYGLYVADIGTDMYVQGDPDSQWSSGTLSQIQALHASDFEFVDMSPVTTDPRFDANSFAASW